MCPGLNFAENGTPLKAAENNCYVAKLRYQLSLDLRAGRDPLNGMTVGEALKRLGAESPDVIRKEMSTGHLNEVLRL